MYFFNRELHLKDTKSAIKNKLIHAWAELRCFKFVTRLVIEFKKKKIESGDATKYVIFYSNSKAETIINESDTDDVFD